MGNYWWYITVLLKDGADGRYENEQILYSAAELSGSIGTEVQELPDGIRMRIYYHSGDEISSWRGKLLDAFEPWPGVKIEDMGKIENQQWSRQSEDAFPPLEVGRTLVVLAPWHKGRESSERVPIYINPGSAFGTGYHESTQAALELFERRIGKNGRAGRVADVGTGSGILSIAAFKLGAESILARDIDPTAVEEAKNNMKLNGILPAHSDKITIETGDLLQGIEGLFDLIFANILLEPLVSMLPSVPRVLAPGGIAVFSGITSREKAEFIAALSGTGLEITDQIEKEEWWSVAAQNPA
ncbi:MAG: 50S ribosomal protein L11 methyltransferase [Synergistaceae bacterium]|jgi:ribosomal protein L11 methyltransferase|nr:50S ribosomal protein L11 methyltransferase [Synergistaceae bacterium]